VPDAKTNADGESKGEKIVGGQQQTLSAGDLVTVHAGTPHQLLIPVGTIYGSVVVKVHEP
jgi:mannose-6-phosphate isomerase-like protein (cupin superfamily)